MKEKIRLEKLEKSFEDNVVLADVSLTIQEGEIFSIIGESGSGKSVILKHLIGLIEPDSGGIYVDGIKYTGAPEETRMKIQSKYGVLFQGAALFDSMKIYDNVAFGLRRKKLPEEEIKRIVTEMMANVGLKDVEEKKPSELSGGMQKRAALARAIALKPEIMLYDEPSTGVDLIAAGAIDRLILKMRDTFGNTSVVVTHNMESAYRISDRIAMLFEGRIIFIGTPDEIKMDNNPYVRQFIEGRADGPIKVAK